MITSSIQSVGRAFAVLDHLVLGSATLTALSQVLGVSAPGALKIMKTLEELGLVRQLADKRYELAVGCGKYSRAYCEQHPLRELARPVLEELSLRINDRVVLSAQEGVLQVTLLVVDPRQGLRQPELDIPSGPHPSLQLATGRVLLAHAPLACAQAQFERYPAGYLPADLQSMPGVEAMLRQVRADGFSLVPTAQVQVRYLGVPVFNHAGVVVAALGLHITEPRSVESSLEMALQAAAQVSNALVS